MSQKELFVKACNELYDKDKASMESSCNAYNIAIENNQNELIDILRDRDIMLMKLNAIKSRPTLKEWVESEYDTLLATPYVKDVVIKNDRFIVYTNTITITYGGRSYSVGKFLIEYLLGSHDISSLNLTTNQRKSFSSDVNVRELLSRYQYVTAIQLVIDNLITYQQKNVDTPTPSYKSVVSDYYSMRDSGMYNKKPAFHGYKWDD